MIPILAVETINISSGFHHTSTARGEGKIGCITLLTGFSMAMFTLEVCGMPGHVGRLGHEPGRAQKVEFHELLGIAGMRCGMLLPNRYPKIIFLFRCK